MEYTDLEYFIAIAEHHNLTRAAEALYVSQPTLTKYLHKLEKELGGKVFRRNGYQYDLTFLGQRYLDYNSNLNKLTDKDDTEKFGDCNFVLENNAPQILAAVHQGIALRTVSVFCKVDQ